MTYTSLIICVFFIMLLSLFEKNLSKSIVLFLYFFSISVLSLIFSMRDVFHTPDTYVYFKAFQYTTIEQGWFSRGYSNFEGGFAFVIRLCKLIGINNFRVFFFITSIIGFIVLYFAFRNFNKCLLNKNLNHKPRYMLFLTIYVSFYGIYYQGIVLRAGLNIVFILLAVSYFLQQRRLLSVVFFIIALSFHANSTVAILIIPILLFSKKMDKRVYTTSLIIFLVLEFLGLTNYITIIFSPILNGLTSSYPWLFDEVASYVINGEISGGIALKTIYMLLIGIYIAQKDMNDAEFAKIYNIFFLGTIIMTFFGHYSVMTRVTDYYCVFYTVLLAVLIHHCEEKRKKLIMERNVLVQNINFNQYTIIECIFVCLNLVIMCRNIKLPLI